MIWQIIKKQGLVLLRNPLEILLLIGLPIILIAILGTALSNMMDDHLPDIHVKVALMEHEKEEEQVERFMTSLKNKGLPLEEINEIEASIEEMKPIHILKETVFGNDELKDIVEWNEMDPTKKKLVMEDNTYTAIIEIPENFTYETLAFMVLDETPRPSLHIIQNEGSQHGVSMVNNILQQFQEELTLGTFLTKNGLDQQVSRVDQERYSGEAVSINQKKTVTTKGYYTVGMAVMNVLFIASVIGSFAFKEKKTHVFNRIILADTSRWVYFVGILLAGTIFGLLQLLIIYGFSWLVFGVSWPHVIPFLTITVFYAFAIGGIAVLLTAISYRTNSEMMTNFFAGILVAIMAFLGGSFFPIGDSVKLIEILGNMTPNGAGMSAYLSILRGDSLSEIGHHLLFLAIFALLSIVIAALSFPKRGASI